MKSEVESMRSEEEELRSQVESLRVAKEEMEGDEMQVLDAEAERDDVQVGCVYCRLHLSHPSLILCDLSNRQRANCDVDV